MSQDAGADVTADEFAAALKLIVKRLEGQEDGAETPPRGSDSDSTTAAAAPRDTAPQPALDEPLWTGLSDSLPPEPEATSSPDAGSNVSLDPTHGAEPTAGREPLFSEPPPVPEPAKDPLFVETPVSRGGDDDPLFATKSSTPAADPEPPAAEPAADPLFSTPPEPASGGKEPLFVDTSAPAPQPPSAGAGPAVKEPLFVETPAAGAEDPLFASKPPPSDHSPFTVEGGVPTEGSTPAGDPMAGLWNREDAPTIGPAMPSASPSPSPSPSPSASPSPAPPQDPDTAADPRNAPDAGGADADQMFGTAAAPSGLDYPEPDGPGAESPAIDASDTPAPGGLGDAPDDPFAEATRPAFEDDRANALFGDTPPLSEDHAPGSSLGPIGAESELFGKEETAEPLFVQPAEQPDDAAAALTASRELGDDADSGVELDQILPPLDPEAGSLEKAATPPRPKRRLPVGAAAFWLLILAILGGISFWGYQERHQTAALGEWAQARYGLPSGQLAAFLATDPAPDVPAAPTDTRGDPAAVPADPAGAPSAPDLPDAIEPPSNAREAAPAPATIAAATPPRLPDQQAPLPADVSPQIRALADRALSGDPLAQHDLANQYAVGESVAQSNSYAAYWYRLASEAGIANAQYNLGVLTVRGLGVPKDLAGAFRMFLSAAEAGHADAQIATGLAYMYGSGTLQNRLQAASWFQAASANGRPRGAYHLGQLFELGLDEPPDLAAAAGWYRIAADAGHGQAREALERLTAALRPAPSPDPAPSTVSAPASTPTPVPPSPAPVAAAPSELVRETQQLLNQLGYDAGREDGMLGEKTKQAISAFQRSQGLIVSGEASGGLLALLQLVAGE